MSSLYKIKADCSTLMAGDNLFLDRIDFGQQLTSAVGSGETLSGFNMTWWQLWSRFGKSKNVLHVRTSQRNQHNERGVGWNGSSLPISHWSFVNNAQIWNKCLCWVFMSWVWMQAWKQHFHMGRIKRSTVLQSQQLHLNMLGYTQPTLAGKRSPCPLHRQWRLWKTLCESAFYPCRSSWERSLKLPLGSHVFRWEKSVFTVWHERCWTIAVF